MLNRFLGISQSEKSKILLFAFLGFCWSIASSTGVALSDALLLEHVGSHSLSYVFAFTAVGMFLTSGFLMYLYNRFEIDKIFAGAFITGIVFNCTIFALIISGVSHPALWILFKVFGYFFQVGFLSLFFTYLDQFFEMQNAKTVFGMLYSPIFLGMAVSGAVLALSSTKLGTFGILCLVICALCVALFLLKLIPSKVEKIPDDYQEFTVIKTGKKDLIRAIFTSRFTLLFLLAGLALHAILVITEFQYMSGLEQTFLGQGPEKLTEFLGRLYFYGSLVNILFGLFFYGRIVKKVGLNNVILIVPLFFTALFSFWQSSSHIFLPILGFIAVEGVLNLLEDNNFNLLLNAVPLKLKNKIRVTCESILEPLGMLISALLLMAFQHHSKKLGLYIALIFLGITLLMRLHYTKGIFDNLIAHLIPFQKRDDLFKSRVTKKDFIQNHSLFLSQFSELKPLEQSFVLQLALRFNDSAFLEKLFKKVTKMSADIKLKALELLEDYPRNITVRYLPYFQFWMKQHPSLETEFFFHLAKMKLLDASIAQKHLDHPNTKIKGACLLALRQKLPRSYESKQARKTLYELLISPDEDKNAIAIQILKYHPLKDFKSKVFDLFPSASFDLKKQILKTLGYLLEAHDTQYASVLMGFLKDDTYQAFRHELLDALSKVADPFCIKELLIQSYSFSRSEKATLVDIISKMGNEVIPEIESIFQNSHLPEQIRLLAARLLSKLAPRHLKFYYHKIVKNEIERAFFYYYHLHTDFQNLSKQNALQLKEALQNSFDTSFGFIVETLALIHRFENTEHLVHSLRSKHPKTYGHAFETLDKMCSWKLYRLIEPIVEKWSPHQFKAFYLKQKLPSLTLDNLLDYLHQSPSYVNQKLASHLREILRPEPTSQNTNDSPSHRLHHFTLKLLEVS